MSALAVEDGPPSSITAALALVRSYGALRRAEPHHVPALRVVADAGFADLLPRWQRFGEGVHEAPEPAAYAGTLAWRSRRHWLDVVVPAAVAARPEALRDDSGWSVGRRTFLEYARWMADYAHTETGRRCIVRNDTIAALLGRSERTVQRCHRVAEVLGLRVVVTPGRMLTQHERWRAYWSGSRQRGYATDAALCVPEWLDREAAWAPAPAPAQRPGLEIVTPPKRFNPQPENLPVGDSLGPSDRFAGGKEPAPRAPLSGEAGPAAFPGGMPAGKAPQKRSGRAYDPFALTLAIELVGGLAWLRGVPAGRIETALRRFVRCSLPWTAQDVSDAIDARNARLGNASMTPERVRNGPALLAAILRDLDPDADHPRQHDAPDAERRQWASRRRAQAQALVARERRAAGPRTPEVRDAAVAALRDELRARRAAVAEQEHADWLAARQRRREQAAARARALRAERDN